MTTRIELYRGFIISWQEPPETGANWTANVGSEEPHLYALMGRHGAEIIKGQNREEMILNARRYVDRMRV